MPAQRIRTSESATSPYIFLLFYAEKQKRGALHALKFKIHGAIFAE